VVVDSQRGPAALQPPNYYGHVAAGRIEPRRGEVARLEVELPAEARRLYARHIAAVRKGIEDQERQGVGPEKVADAVQHALLARRPRTRYAVGTDARIQFALVRLLPDRPREAIIRRFAGP